MVGLTGCVHALEKSGVMLFLSLPELQFSTFDMHQIFLLNSNKQQRAISKIPAMVSLIDIFISTSTPAGRFKAIKNCAEFPSCDPILYRRSSLAHPAQSKTIGLLSGMNFAISVVHRSVDAFNDTKKI